VPAIYQGEKYRQVFFSEIDLKSDIFNQTTSFKIEVLKNELKRDL